MFSFLTHWILMGFQSLDYWSITVLMAVESSLIPFPSEIIIPPAGYLASLGQLNLLGVIVAGVIGSLIGALFNYFLALTAGRAILYSLAESRWGKMLLLSPKKLDRSEAYFNQYGKVATLIGRLLPAIRQLISLPAGLAEMPLGSFIIFTTLGSAIWVTILAVAGYTFGANQTAIMEYYRYFKEITWIVLSVLAIIAIIYFLKKSKRRK